ncbi:arylesterase [Litorivicinus lipolyticus]|uniref:Arylesterase n=1 Tax=Litorivicinus lipolyticus TaxID=418701 RepID=A0A5Q2QBY9_9GAMM|nr:arylesterase [Litorivicinus lipolyticus]QGG79782.1 arylesterase [Litorivicinus lipolyticus]
MRLFLLSLCLWIGVAHSAPILVFGDSLSAAYGLEEEQGWAWLLKSRLQSNGDDREVINLSVSGETTGGGLARLPDALARYQPSIVVLELGANDGLRGLSPARMQANLSRMIESAQAIDAQVLVLGMRLPPSYGKRYVDRFEATYPRLAEQHQVALMPFMLAPLGVDESLFQDDRLHPTADAQPILLDAIWPFLAPLL